jgi:hypothetical protein
MTLSVAMTTNLGTAVAPASPAPQSPAPLPEPQQAAPAPVLPAPTVAAAPLATATVAQPTPPRTTESALPIPALRDRDAAHTQPSAGITPAPSAAQISLDARTIRPQSEQDPLELLRKVCHRFHAVARQLRLRKDYRATLEVEDDYDLQDLLSALLKMEFDEVGANEWTPSYAGGAPRTTLLLNREQIAVVVKKTRPGLTTKELADQVAVDSAYYMTRDRCTTMFCFIYDPEGRIGSPKRLETDLTSVSDRYTVEVLVAPK